MNQNKEFIDFLLNEYFLLKGSLLLAQYSNIEQRIRGFHSNKGVHPNTPPPFYQLSKWLQSVVYLIQHLDSNRHPRLENVQVGLNLLNLTIAEIPDSYLAYFKPGFLSMTNHHFAAGGKRVGSRSLRSLCVVEKYNLGNDALESPRQLLTLLDLFNFYTYPDTINSLLLYLVDLDTLSPQQFIDFQNVFSNWVAGNLFDLGSRWNANNSQLCGVVFARLMPDFVNKKQALFPLKRTATECFWSDQLLPWVKTAQELSNRIFDSFPSFSHYINLNSLFNQKYDRDFIPLTRSNTSVEDFASQVNNLSKVLFVIAAWPLASIHRILSLKQKILNNATYPSMGIIFELLLPYLLKLLQSYHLFNKYLLQNRLAVDKDLRGLFNTLSHHLEEFLKYIALFLIEYTHISHNSELWEFVQIYLIQEYTSTTLSHSIQYRKGLIYNIDFYFNNFQVIDFSCSYSHLIFQLIQDCSIKPKNSTTFNRANVLGGVVGKNAQKRLKAIQLTNSDALRVQTTVYSAPELYLNAMQLILHIIRQGWHKLNYSQQSAVVKLVSDHLGLFTKGQLELEDKYLIALLKMADTLSHIPHSNQANISIMCFEVCHVFRSASGELAECCKHSISRISRLIHPELLHIPLSNESF
ncbi:hypothetical protein CONCODRAFT_170999 [Conidiobolus coronatus NRRL 28638]|uniref:Uncharacterized protein n=1 Tax=Conidiobolus coronatus (strain ATCC 28846 / CBS 209.66 / NRRL 28638) TaxID=796925 RepID=A0A137P592_CONC2|nr:hypothetical protein CONCODRAFT_170999 [Conidiobolus coronatus NRRL 28638]|eukprot:KXN70104.1 hypothetical protein CONCODRAFT_170999 [Conidiobolus coronatus NRRL 28638]